ncbi:MAG: glutamine--fructose-6-phosphate transaminase (isomerizing) [Sphingomonadales bacterium]
MCGIIGILGDGDVAPAILEGLKRLEYRGYDSAGIATLENGGITRRRAQGKLNNLAALIDESPLVGDIGIGHTRWATHGAPVKENAHPHSNAKVAVVHNGIIENFRELRCELEAAGHKMVSDTDTEVIVHLITKYLDQGFGPRDAAAAALKRLEGAFALGIIFAGEHDLMIGARRGSPLAIGYGDGQMYLGSDALAVGPFTNRICYLEEGDWVELSRDGAVIHDADDAVVEREIKQILTTGSVMDKGNYRHFMLKEIYEQPQVVGETLSTYFNPLTRQVELPEMAFDLATISRITLIACGTSSYAASVAKYWFETVARVPVEVDIASEFRYREAEMPENGLAVFISQSGETADTLAALRYARSQNQHIAVVVNVPESSMAREADVIFPTHAGPEIGVASTKAFTCQLTVLACLVIATAKARGAIVHDEEARLCEAIIEVPARAAEVLNHDEKIEKLAHDLAKARDVLYLGRGSTFPIAMEGALKLKEISYIHAEGYAAGEMKHGPIALIDESVPVIVIAPADRLFEKTTSNMQEVIARGGKVLLLSDEAGVASVGQEAWEAIALPGVDEFVAPILYAIPVQLLAYHTAVVKGTDVDQPRNLAKSVTVE